MIYPLVNLHADNLDSSPEYFILTSTDLDKHLKTVVSGRDYIDYNYVVRLDCKDRWDKI